MSPPHLNQHSHSAWGWLDWHFVPVHSLASRSASTLGHHTQLFAKLFILAMPGPISRSSWITRSLPGGGTTTLAPQRTQPSSTLNSFLLQFCCTPPFGSWEVSYGAQIFALEPALCLCPSLDLLDCLRRYNVQILQEQEGDWNNLRSLRKWQTAWSWNQAVQTLKNRVLATVGSENCKQNGQPGYQAFSGFRFWMLAVIQNGEERPGRSHQMQWCQRVDTLCIDHLSGSKTSCIDTAIQTSHSWKNIHYNKAIFGASLDF